MRYLKVVELEIIKRKWILKIKNSLNNTFSFLKFLYVFNLLQNVYFIKIVLYILFQKPNSLISAKDYMRKHIWSNCTVFFWYNN